MGKYKPYSRREFRRRLIDWIRQNVKLVVLLTVGMFTLFVFETVLLAAVVQPTAVSWWLLGLLQAALVAAYLHLLHAGFLAHDREAIRHLRGAWGEDNTRDELRRAKRKRLIWGSVDSITLQGGDLDHLVVTRRGGLVAIDSKWRNHASDTIDMSRAAHRARTRAEALARTLLKGESRARHRAKVNPVKVTPVVVIWGAAQHNVPNHARVNDIEFVAGHHLVTWLTRLSSESVTKAAAADIINRLERFRAETWDTTAAG